MSVEDKPAWHRPHVTKFGIPTPRKLTPDVRHWTWTSKGALVAETGTPLFPTFAGQLIRVRCGIKTAGSSATSGTLAISGTTVASWTIPASVRLGYPVRPSVKARWTDTDYLEVVIATIGTGAVGPLTVILDYIRSEL